jgi:TRAP-type mannitol/chloroaromatic compound transport system substrate-binding protein
MENTKRASPEAAGEVNSRRRFLGGAAALGGAATLAALPGCGGSEQAATGEAAELPRINLRMQGGYPSRDPFFEIATDFTRIISDLTGGQLTVELLPAGAVVGAFDQADAVHRGILDASHAVPAFWYGKNTALSLFGTGPAFGQDANMLISWFYYGGGQALYDELYQDILKLDVVGMLYGPMINQPTGWFRREVKTRQDFQGLKYRTVGLSIDLFKAMGASVVAIPGGEIVPSLERGVIDAAEFNNPASDQALGFPDVSKICMVQGFHQPSECFEVLYSRRVWDSLPKLYQNVLRYASWAASADMSWKIMDIYSKAYENMRDNRGVRFIETPTDILKAKLEAWDKVIAEKSAENPFFKKVYESQRDYMKRIVGFHIKFYPEMKLPYNHFFGKLA